MRHTIALLSVVLTLRLAAPAAHAQLASPVPAGFNHLYSVPGNEPTTQRPQPLKGRPPRGKSVARASARP